jgi:hypothetical protein
MSVEETKQVVEAFVRSSEGCWLAETVQLSSPTRVVADGRDAVRDALARLHSSQVVDDPATQTRFVVADGIAAVEIRLRPTDDHERQSVATDGHGSARWGACFYEVSGGEIVRASVHIDTATTDTATTDRQGEPRADVTNRTCTPSED